MAVYILLYTLNLSEIEARDPEDRRLVTVQPILEEFQSQQQVSDIAAQWLEAGVGPLCPVVWDFADEEGVR